MLDPLNNAWLKDRQARVNEDRYRDAALMTPVRERIEKAADDLFSKYYVHVVTLQHIADRAVTNTEYVLECFGSLENIYAGYLENRIDPEKNRWKALEDVYPGAPEKQLRAWIESIASNIERGADPLPLSTAAMQLGYLPNHPAHIFIRKNNAALRDTLRALCHDAIYRDPDGLAEKLLFLAQGALVQSTILGAEGHTDRLIEAAEDLFKRHA